ncbi:MAG: FAD-dependent oxidoreductase, partial [Gammaproteobacteria bacterium]|nr:FAD-dependent oxidoreductase [Gammaproteobacteria bacterium]
MNRSLIIGGGAIGMLTALQLREAGHRVMVFERGATGRESSWAGGGIISPLFPWRYLDSVTRLASWSQAHYPDFCDQIAQSTGIDPEYTPSGLILIAHDERAQAQAWATQHDRVVETIDRERFAQLEPQAATPVDGALWMPQVGQVRNPRLLRALRLRLDQLGVEVRSDDAVQRLLVDDGGCHGLLSASGTYTADAVVV